MRWEAVKDSVDLFQSNTFPSVSLGVNSAVILLLWGSRLAIKRLPSTCDMSVALKAVLIERADTEAKINEKMTPLHQMTWNKHFAVVRTGLKRKASETCRLG